MRGYRSPLLLCVLCGGACFLCVSAIESRGDHGGAGEGRWALPSLQTHRAGVCESLLRVRWEDGEAGSLVERALGGAGVADDGDDAKENECEAAQAHCGGEDRYRGISYRVGDHERGGGRKASAQKDGRNGRFQRGGRGVVVVAVAALVPGSPSKIAAYFGV